MWRIKNPDKAGVYLVKLEDGTKSVMEWCGGWNCTIDPITGETYRLNERFDIVTWDVGPFEEFTVYNSGYRKVSVRVDAINYVSSNKAGYTEIRADGESLYAKESYEEVMKRIYSHFA